MYVFGTVTKALKWVNAVLPVFAETHTHMTKYHCTLNTQSCIYKQHQNMGTAHERRSMMYKLADNKCQLLELHPLIDLCVLIICLVFY